MTEIFDLFIQLPDVVRQPSSAGEAVAWCPWHDDKAAASRICIST